MHREKSSEKLNESIVIHLMNIRTQTGMKIIILNQTKQKSFEKNILCRGIKYFFDRHKKPLMPYLKPPIKQFYAPVIKVVYAGIISKNLR
jgi:hypothetical protein